jgi:hypothetical protein
MRIRTGESPELLFLSELTESLARERVVLSQEGQVYIMRLLSRVRADEERCPDRYLLAPDYLRALSLDEGHGRTLLLRGVGDVALLLAGWWWRYTESLRRGPSFGYHIDLGWSAYHLIDGVPFDELSEKFIGLVDVLARMSAQLQRGDQRQLVKLYSHWCRTNSRQARRLLAVHGIPVTETPVLE